MPATHRRTPAGPAPAVLSPVLGLVVSLLLALVAGTLLAAPSSAMEEPEPDPEENLFLGAPREGRCSTLSYEQAYEEESVSSATRPCRKWHTTQVVAVNILPSSASYDDEDIATTISDGCSADLDAVHGKNELKLRRTLYASWIFVPTKAQQEQGARWYRCDVSLAANQKLLRVKGSYAKVKKGAVPDRAGRCVTRKFTYTLCSKKHAWEHHGAARSPKLSKQQAKRDRQVQKFAQQTCSKKVGKRFVWAAFTSRPRTVVVVCFKKA